MKAHALALGSLLGLAASPTFATVLALSNFSLDADGWLAKNGSSDIAWVASGGSPGAFVDAHDQGSGLWFFAAPAKFIVQAPKAYGGFLDYQMRTVSVTGPIAGSYADVMLVANDNSYLSYFGNFNPTASWQGFSVPITTGASWVYGSSNGSQQQATAQEFQNVLSNLVSLRIRGDYRAQGEVTGLDTVLLIAPAVPEPAPLAMWIGGTMLLGWVALRRRNQARWPN